MYHKTEQILIIMIKPGNKKILETVFSMLFLTTLPSPNALDTKYKIANIFETNKRKRQTCLCVSTKTSDCKEHAKKNKKDDRPQGNLRRQCLTSTSADVTFTDPVPLLFPSQTHKYRPRTF